ncbi:transcription termination factor 2-like [Boleophthalmus pectinirostris]|uniref:transcription termination factor 2-like n=1 Tax=Boleophthalmus pectinirostris TaxID=150288 RepID=UPI0024319907|nr:transcription termination factor 2-like [Boleophthalmus pectinirostris]
MEKVVCKSHGAVCMLKTGVREGPNKGKSFYVCVDKQGCDFSQAVSLPPSHCLQHEESTVELQALTYSQQQQNYRLFYRCVVSKKAGQKWCGNVPWTAPSKEKRSPLAESQQQPSCMPPVRNPFKAPAKTDCNSESRKIQSSAEGSHLKTVLSEAKENGELGPSNTSQQRVLPAGMKLKKCTLKEDSNKKQAEQTRATAKEQTQDQTRSTPTEQTLDGQGEPASDSGPADKGSGPFVSTEQEQDKEEDDDEVVLLCVQPPAPKAPAYSAVQKTLTTFPGFQRASKLQPTQDHPHGLRNMLSSQLQQKKATLGAVNLDALPDKGARLKTQVKELEDALDALSLSTSSQTGAETGPSCRAPITAKAPVNPFSRPGGTVLLPAPPGTSQGPQTSGSSVGLQLSQNSAHMLGDPPPAHVFYGGRMTEDRLLAVKNATCKAIDHLHKSLESCPGADTEAPDPKGIKVHSHFSIVIRLVSHNGLCVLSCISLALVLLVVKSEYAAFGLEKYRFIYFS